MDETNKSDSDGSKNIDKHKAWLIAGISIAILAIAILIPFPMFTGETGLAGKATTQPDNLILHYTFDESPVNDLTKDSGKKGIDGTVDGATWVPKEKGDNLLVDGDMEIENVDGWDAYNSAILTKETDQNNKLIKIKHTGTHYPTARQLGILEIDKSYKVTGKARSNGNVAPYVLISGSVKWTGTLSTDWQDFEFEGIAGINYLQLTMAGSGVSEDYVEYDDVKVTEIESGHFKFDGVDDNIGLGLIDYTGFSKMTVSAWFNKENTNTEIIFANHKGGSYSFQLGTVGDKVWFNFRNAVPGDYFQVVSDDTYNANELNHVVGVYDGSNVKVYLNGAEKIGSEATGNINNYPDKSTLIGMGIKIVEGDEFPQSPLNGLIDDVKMWDVALTSDEICKEAEKWDFVKNTCTIECVPDCAGKSCGDDGCGGSCGTCEPELLTHYTFDDGTATDLSGNENNGVVDGATWSFKKESDNILVDGDMEYENTDVWDSINSAIVTKKTGDPKEGSRYLRVQKDDVENPYVRQSTAEMGKTYRMTGYTRSDGTATCRVFLGDLNKPITVTKSTLWSYFDVIRTAKQKHLIGLLALTSNGGEYCEFDEVQITEVEGAFEFDGDDDEIRPGENIDFNFGEDDFSFEVSIKADPEQGNYAGILYKQVHSSGLGYRLTILNGKLLLNVGEGLDENQLAKHHTFISKTTVNDNLWHDVVVTVDRDDKLQFYIDGILNHEYDISTKIFFPDSDAQFLIGGKHEWFNGLIDDVKIWNGVLSEEDICTEAGNKWENGACIPDLVCDSFNLNLCGTQDSCTVVGGHWYEVDESTGTGICDYDCPEGTIDKSGDNVCELIVIFGDDDNNGCLATEEFNPLLDLYLNEDDGNTIACLNGDTDECLTTDEFLPLQHYYLAVDDDDTIACDEN
ncbi:LamG domain-containing protein [Candidatus Woesearchaeota archaeon]|nr:LamG domain-containing protein [Candidatus Woesearchaeota archaeon]